MEPSCDTKAQNLIFAINFATREKKNKTLKWTNTNIQSHLNATLIIPLKMIPNKKKLTIQQYKKSSSSGTHNHNYKN